MTAFGESSRSADYAYLATIQIILPGVADDPADRRVPFAWMLGEIQGLNLRISQCPYNLD
jgi:hypothetical protein